MHSFFENCFVTPLGPVVRARDWEAGVMGSDAGLWFEIFFCKGKGGQRKFISPIPRGGRRISSSAFSKSAPFRILSPHSKQSQIAKHDPSYRTRSTIWMISLKNYTSDLHFFAKFKNGCFEKSVAIEKFTSKSFAFVKLKQGVDVGRSRLVFFSCALRN